MTSPEEIKYDLPVEVSEKAYHILRTDFAGIVAHRVDENGKFWIKQWGGLRSRIANVMNRYPLAK